MERQECPPLCADRTADQRAHHDRRVLLSYVSHGAADTVSRQADTGTPFVERGMRREVAIQTDRRTVPSRSGIPHGAWRTASRQRVGFGAVGRLFDGRGSEPGFSSLSGTWNVGTL